MFKKPIIVSCTRNDINSFKEKPLYKSINVLKVQSNIFTNWIDGLSKAYNQILTDKNFENNIIVFVHDDVLIDDLFFYEKITNLPYPICGLAGTKKYTLNSPHLAWHLASERKEHIGEVSHTKNGKIWTTCFGPTLSSALIIDGLFIAVDWKYAHERQLFFDEDFAWHFYDIAFCLNCYKKQASVGVFPLRVIHYGLGDSMYSESFLEAQRLFKEKIKQGVYKI